MKIGILTYHRVCNFGANLQALSTLCYFRKHGYDPVFINWSTEELDNGYRKSTPESQYKLMTEFQNNNFPMTRLCRTDEDIASVIKEEDIKAIIIGSDAVLQIHPFLSRVVFPCRKILVISKPNYATSCPNPFWGSFYDLLEKKVPICLMSASSQNSPFKTILPWEKAAAKKHLLNFSYISTRDDWTAKMVQKLSDQQILPDVTPDPVFAFNYNVDNVPSREEIIRKFNLPDKYYLFSFHNSKNVSVEWLDQFQIIASHDSIECVALPFPAGVTFKHPFNKEIALPLNPLDWYALIKYSAGYVGNNMHPIVVSLHNAVPCFCFDNYGVIRLRTFVNEKSSKIYHIMNKFDLLENRICSFGAKYKAPIPELVYQKLSSYDKLKISGLSKQYYVEYSNMMEQLTQKLDENVKY